MAPGQLLAVKENDGAASSQMRNFGFLSFKANHARFHKIHLGTKKFRQKTRRRRTGRETRTGPVHRRKADAASHTEARKKGDKNEDQKGDTKIDEKGRRTQHPTARQGGRGARMEKWEARRGNQTTRSGRRKRRRETRTRTRRATRRSARRNRTRRIRIRNKSEGTLPEGGRNIRQEGVQFKNEGRRGDQKRR